MAFNTTLWSQLLAAGDGNREAQSAVLERYRPPLLRYLRGRGLSPEDSEDVSQEVLLRLLEQDLLERADPDRGRFRSFLLKITRYVLSERTRRDQAIKRGGQARVIPIDAIGDIAETPSDPAFDRCWLEDILRRAMEAVAREHPRHYELLKRTAGGSSPADIAEGAERNVGAVRVDLHRARKRLAARIRDELSELCASEDEFEEELRLVQRLL